MSKKINHRDTETQRRQFVLISWWLSALVVCCPLFAQDARQIVEEAQRRTQVQSERYEGTLQVFNERGTVAEKRWLYRRFGSHGASKAVLRFTAPAEVRGVALLILNHPDRASDQWMWTPALQRERRIALQDRSTRFFGTDFSFEDLEERDVDQYDYRLVGEDSVDGAACWQIESRPRKTRVSQYTYGRLWIRKDNYAFARFEGYVKEALVRRVDYRQIERISGIWTARVLEVAEARRKSRTVLRLEKLEYNLPMREDDFTIPAVRRE